MSRRTGYQGVTDHDSDPEDAHGSSFTHTHSRVPAPPSIARRVIRAATRGTPQRTSLAAGSGDRDAFDDFAELPPPTNDRPPLTKTSPVLKYGAGVIAPISLLFLVIVVATFFLALALGAVVGFYQAQPLWNEGRIRLANLYTAADELHNTTRAVGDYFGVDDIPQAITMVRNIHDRVENMAIQYGELFAAVQPLLQRMAPLVDRTEMALDGLTGMMQAVNTTEGQEAVHFAKAAIKRYLEHGVDMHLN